MAKYRPLEEHLTACEAEAAPMTFGEIEAVLGASLPAAAHMHRSWWSNNPANNVMTRSWLAAGYRTEQVDLAGRRLVFRRMDSEARSTPRTKPAAWPAANASTPLLERLWTSLGGTVRTPKLAELTDPVGDAWDTMA